MAECQDDDNEDAMDLFHRLEEIHTRVQQHVLKRSLGLEAVFKVQLFEYWIPDWLLSEDIIFICLRSPIVIQPRAKRPM